MISPVVTLVLGSADPALLEVRVVEGAGFTTTLTVDGGGTWAVAPALVFGLGGAAVTYTATLSGGGSVATWTLTEAQAAAALVLRYAKLIYDGRTIATGRVVHRG